MPTILVIGDMSKDIARDKPNLLLWGLVGQIVDADLNASYRIAGYAEDIGIQGLAYRLAKVKRFDTISFEVLGPAPDKAFPVKERMVLNTPSELEKAIFMECDFLVRVGGDEASKALASKFATAKGLDKVKETDFP